MTSAPSGPPFQDRYPWLTAATMLLLVAAVIACLLSAWNFLKFLHYATMHVMSQPASYQTQMDHSLLWYSLYTLGLALSFMISRDILRAFHDIAQNSFNTPLSPSQESQ